MPQNQPIETLRKTTERFAWRMLGMALSVLFAAQAQAATLTVTGTVDNSSATITVNGVAATVTGTTFRAVIPVDEGPNIIQARATAPGGASSTKTIVVYFSAGLNVKGTVGTSSPVPTVKVNTVTATVNSSGQFTATVPFTLGENTITVTATNSAGQTTQTRSVFMVRPPIDHP